MSRIWMALWYFLVLCILAYDCMYACDYDGYTLEVSHNSMLSTCRIKMASLDLRHRVMKIWLLWKITYSNLRTWGHIPCLLPSPSLTGLFIAPAGRYVIRWTALIPAGQNELPTERNVNTLRWKCSKINICSRRMSPSCKLIFVICKRQSIAFDIGRIRLCQKIMRLCTELFVRQTIK